MHIAQLLPELNEGGVERGTVDLNRELVQRGHRSSVFSAGGRQAPQIDTDGGQHHTVPIAGKNPLTAPLRRTTLRRTLDTVAPDLLHVRSRVPAWLAWMANKEAKRPLVTTVHGFNSVSRYSEIMAKGDRVICVSQAIREFVLKHYQPDPDCLRVIPRGIDLAYFDPDKVDANFVRTFRKQYDLGDEDFVVTSIGRLTGLKDYETFLRAFARLRWEVPNVRGLIVGGTHRKKQRYARSLRLLASELALDGMVHFVGSVREIREIYAMSNVIVSASKKPESFGRTCGEALAMGRPVVATNHGGAPEIIRDGIHGQLIPIESPDALAEAVQQCQSLSRGGYRQHIEAHFTLEQMIEKTLAVYQELLS